MILIISWKNIWRNRLRSMVVIIAVTFGLIAGVFSGGLMNGASEQRINQALANEITHIQLHHAKFMENNDMDYTINNTDSIMQYISQLPEVKATGKRLVVSGMAKTAKTVTGAIIYGINPINEKNISTLYKAIPDSMGTYFEKTKRNPILISQKMAKELGAKLRSTIIINCQTTHGNITQAAFKVCGIYKTSNSVFDQMNVFVRYNDLQKITGIAKNQSHEITVVLNNRNDTDIIKTKLQNQLSSLSVLDWKTLSPEVGMMSKFMNFFLYVFVIIILSALAFGIVNTMLMVVLERTKELGMLMAIGMNKKRIFKMIMTETVLLSFTGGFIGIVLGAVSIMIFSNTGINLTKYGEGFEAIGFSSVIYPSVGFEYFIGVAVLVVLTGILASIYPARKALKLNPAEAVRTDN